MYKKYVLLNKDNVVVQVFKYDQTVLEQESISAGLESNPTFVEVPTTNQAKFGWYFDGTDYVPHTQESQ